jgi:hypothetical protein
MSLVNAHKILSFRFRQFGPFIERRLEPRSKSSCESEACVGRVHSCVERECRSSYSAWLDQRMSLVNAHKILSFRFRQFGPFIARFGDGLDP